MCNSELTDSESFSYSFNDYFDFDPPESENQQDSQLDDFDEFNQSNDYYLDEFDDDDLYDFDDSDDNEFENDSTTEDSAGNNFECSFNADDTSELFI